MEGFQSATPFATLVSESLADGQFTLLDIGCSSGIDPVWRVFGERLRAFAFDPNVNEIARLREQENLPGITYVSAYVGFPNDDGGAGRLRTKNYWARNPGARLSVTRTLEIRAQELAKADEAERTKFNLWHQVSLAKSDEAIIIPQFLQGRKVDDVDFVKIDVDGPDFLILRSLSDTLHNANVLGVGIEVNFFGSDSPEIHTFHNVDRLMKKNGFELFSLSTRPYSVAALPAPYLQLPAKFAWGRPFQGDAIYLRDAAAPEHEQWALAVSPHKLAKLAALFSVIGLPDCAAEILLCFRVRIAEQLDVERGLELLIAQCIPVGEPVPSLAQYLAEFESGAARFSYALHDNSEPNRESHEDVSPNLLEEKPSATEVAQSMQEGNFGAVQPTRDDLIQEVASLRGSTTWRLTAPLRAVADAFKRVLRGSR